MIHKFLRHIRKNKSYQYKEKFSSFEEAKRFSEEVSEYFDNRLLKFQGPKDVEVTDRFYVVSIITSLLNKKKIDILDVGGGSQPAFSYIKQSTGRSINCTVLETEKFIKIISKKIPNKFKKNLKYIYSLSDLKKKHIDIACFNSSIQYFSNYENIIKKISALKPIYMLFTRTPYHHQNNNYYSLQCVIKHPIIFFSFKKFKNLLYRYNYELIFENKYDVNGQEHNAIKLKSFSHKDLIFRKIKKENKNLK
jgi:putative methyltransferase (TIGR04325 family)